jgi:glycosyltransferase involved in cell wall biosynthesis
MDLARLHPEVRVAAHEKNMGKGAALRTGFHLATGYVVGIQDADLEYFPADLQSLIDPILEGRADVVLGSRFLDSHDHTGPFMLHYEGNKVLTFLSNLVTGLNLSDMETCYKVFRRDILDRFTLRENRFGFEPEFVAKVARMGLRVTELPISYDGRTKAEGKKIRWKDGLRALYCIVRYGGMNAVFRGRRARCESQTRGMCDPVR